MVTATAAVKEHKKCICVEFGDTNNNKYWEYTLYDDGTAMTAFGRVTPKSKLLIQAVRYQWVQSRMQG